MPAAQQRGETHREVGHLRRVAGVAEVDDAGDAIVLVEEHIVEVEVAVDDLPAKRRQARHDALLEAVEDVGDEATLPAVGDRTEQWAQLGGLFDIPQQLSPCGRMEEGA